VSSVIAAPYVAGVIYDTLSHLSAVTSAVGDRIERRFYSLADGETAYTTPFIVYRHIEPTVNDGPLGGPVFNEHLRFEVAIYDDGRAFSDAVLAAVEAFDAALQDMNVTVPGKGWQITSRQEQEIPDLDIEYGLPFIRVGGIYAFDVG
jgi:hypothetical protein